MLLTIASVPVVAEAATSITSTRVWPAQDYTRITFESATSIRHQMLVLRNPDRIVIDLQDVGTGPELEALSKRIGANDPYVKAVRIGRFKPGTLRLVMDLKAEARPELFTLRPIAEYGHRLVLDVYPAQPVDPLLAALERPASRAEAGSGPDSRTPTARPIDTPPTPSTGPTLSETARSTVAQETSRTLPAKAPAKPGMMDSARPILIVLDAGHGGEDPGARGHRGSHEKNITLSIARKLRALIDLEPNMRAVMTRDGDYFVALQARVQKARAVNADLFVSIHADAFIRPQARGSSVFALSENGATSAAARWLAKRENDADLIGGVNLDVSDPYLKQTLLDLSQTATINDSLRLGKSVLGELGGINTLHKSSVEQAGFAVLKAPDIPSILVETAFISNPEEEKKLNDAAYQDKLAAAILAGIKGYFAKNPPLARQRIAMNP